MHERRDEPSPLIVRKEGTERETMEKSCRFGETIEKSPLIVRKEGTQGETMEKSDREELFSHSSLLSLPNRPLPECPTTQLPN